MHKSHTLLLLFLVLALSGARAAAQCETAKLLPLGGDSQDEFGFDLDLDGNVLIVGSPFDEPSSTGSATVFRRVLGTWVEEQKLVPATALTEARFGHAVAVCGDVAVVGAPNDSQAAFDAGAAFVFRWNGAGWVEEATLLSLDRDPLDEFGYRVAIDGDVIVVGAWHDPDHGTKAGSAHVYRWDGAGWNHEAKLIGSDVTIEDKFGEGLDVSGNILAVGARGDEQVATTSGTVYIFRYDEVGGTWSEETKLVASDGMNFDRLGQTVAIDGNAVIAGAYFADDFGPNSGAAYVFRYDEPGGTWSEEQKLLSLDGAAGDNFGFSVALQGDLAVIGARGDDDAGSHSGSVYVFRRETGIWTQKAKLVPKDGSASDYFGQSVALRDEYLAAGAYRDDDNGSNSGSAYVWEDVSTFTGFNTMGFGTGGTHGVPLLSGTGTVQPGAPVTFAVHGALENAPLFLVAGWRTLMAELKGGVLVPQPNLVLGPLSTGSTGELQLSGSFPASMPDITGVFLQAWIADPSGPSGFAVSFAIWGASD